MNKAELLLNGEYIARFKNPPSIGGIKELLVAPPEDEYWFQITNEKVASLKQAIQMAIKKIQETDGDEKETYQEVVREYTKEIQEIQKSRRYLGKPKQLRGRIKDHIDKDVYVVEIINMPRKWKEQLKNIAEDL